MHLPVVGEIGAGQAQLLRAVAGHRGQDHDRRPGPRRRRHGGALRVDRPRRRAGPDRAGPGAAASTSGRAGEDVAEGDLLVEDGTVLGPAPPRPARRGRPGHRAVPPAAAGRDHLDRVRAARARQPARPRLDLRRQLVPARRRGPPGRRDRLPGRDRPRRAARRSSTRWTTSWSAPTSSSPAAGSPRATTTWSRRRSRRSAASGSAPVAMQPGQAAGLRASSARTAPRSSRCPATRSRRTSPSSMFVLPALRKLMGKTPYVPADRRRPAHPRDLLAGGRRQFVAGEFAVDRGGPHVDAGRRPRVAPDRRPGVVQRVDRGARGRHLGGGRRAGAGPAARRGLLTERARWTA